MSFSESLASLLFNLWAVPLDHVCLWEAQTSVLLINQSLGQSSADFHFPSVARLHWGLSWLQGTLIWAPNQIYLKSCEPLLFHLLGNFGISIILFICTYWIAELPWVPECTALSNTCQSLHVFHLSEDLEFGAGFRSVQTCGLVWWQVDSGVGSHSCLTAQISECPKGLFHSKLLVAHYCMSAGSSVGEVGWRIREPAWAPGGFWLQQGCFLKLRDISWILFQIPIYGNE